MIDITRRAALGAGLTLTAPAARTLANRIAHAPLRAQADLRAIDPVQTSAYITRNFAYLVFDTLFSLDANYRPQPQMVERWAVSDDRLTWRFTLRDGLAWHEGRPSRRPTASPPSGAGPGAIRSPAPHGRCGGAVGG